MKLLMVLALLSTPTFAKCIQLKKNSPKITWTSFKTLAKVGVSGTFKDVTFSGSNKANSIKEVISNSNFKINTASVFSKNAGRDKKISKFFFSTMKGGHSIQGTVSKVTKKKIFVDFIINETTRTIPLNYSIEKNSLSANGAIDVFDFSMNKELAALNKACSALHEGKTWSDVSIKLTANFESCN
jgi:polyisoprenoid-binding protein YceI